MIRVIGASHWRGKAPATEGLLVVVDDEPATINGQPWAHVSASRRSRCPSHEDMMRVREAFLDPSRTVLHIYPPRAEWVDCHPYVLHLWQPVGFDPVPDPWLERAQLVGPLTNEQRRLLAERQVYGPEWAR